jgi:UDP-N-acetylmuramate: L-alanyl-gamma-D-glutamyl-meso-diaminopimelate ligase
MKIHIIGLNDEELCLLAVNLQSRGYDISGSDIDLTPLASNLLKNTGLLPDHLGWWPERIDDRLNAVLLSSHVTPDNPELHHARALGLRIYSLAEYIHYLTQNKTRVLITGSLDTQFPTRLLMHVLEYWEKEVDYLLKQDYTSNGSKLLITSGNDFVIIEAGMPPQTNPKQLSAALLFCPNITLLCGDFEQVGLTTQSESRAVVLGLIKTIVPGGSITYFADNTSLSQMITNLEAPLRKFPYHTPKSKWSGTTKLIETPEGWVPLSVSEDEELRHIDGVRWICQQLGIDATDFYESLSTFG